MIETPFKIPISVPSLGQEEYDALKETIFSGWVTQGPKVRQFEDAFAKRHHVDHAYATTSCTTALHVILKALDIQKGDEVIVPAFTWIATANVIEHCGATVIFADIDLNTFNIDTKEVAKKITSQTKAIIAVHLFGLCANITELKQIAGTIPIIEDAACAAGASSENGMAGSLGIAAAFSFHPRKSITTGEGGMVTTNDTQFGKKIDILRNHGASISEEKRHLSSKPYILPDFDVAGFNYRMTDIQATIGLVQLSKLDKFIQERNQWAEFYKQELQTIPWLKLPQVPPKYGHGWQSFVCLIDKKTAPQSRNSIMESLQKKGISTRPGTHAVHMLGYYKNKYTIQPNDFPNAKIADEQSIAIPLHNRMTENEYNHVVSQLKAI